MWLVQVAISPLSDFSPTSAPTQDMPSLEVLQKVFVGNDIFSILVPFLTPGECASLGLAASWLDPYLGQYTSLHVAVKHHVRMAVKALPKLVARQTRLAELVVRHRSTSHHRNLPSFVPAVVDGLHNRIRPGTLKVLILDGWTVVGKGVVRALTHASTDGVFVGLETFGLIHHNLEGKGILGPLLESLRHCPAFSKLVLGHVATEGRVCQPQNIEDSVCGILSSIDFLHERVKSLDLGNVWSSLNYGEIPQQLAARLERLSVHSREDNVMYFDPLHSSIYFTSTRMYFDPYDTTFNCLTTLTVGPCWCKDSYKFILQGITFHRNNFPALRHLSIVGPAFDRFGWVVGALIDGPVGFQLRSLAIHDYGSTATSIIPFASPNTCQVVLSTIEKATVEDPNEFFLCQIESLSLVSDVPGVVYDTQPLRLALANGGLPRLQSLVLRGFEGSFEGLPV